MFPSSRTPWFVWGILALAAVLRLWSAGNAPFYSDETFLWLTARRIATGEEFPVFGPMITATDARIPNASFFYIMALPQLLGAHPMFGCAFVALLHLVLLYGFYRLVEQASGARAGILALMLTAFSPWEIAYGNHYWNADFPQMFTMLMLLAVVHRGSRVWQVVGGLAVVLAPAVHLSAPVAWAMAAWLMLRQRGRAPHITRRWGFLVLGVLLGVATYVPAFIYDANHGFRNARLVVEKTGQAVEATPSHLIPLRTGLHAVLMHTAEIGYWLEEGALATKNYDELKAYRSEDMQVRHMKRYGALGTALVVVSLLVSLVGWLCVFVIRRSRDDGDYSLERHLLEAVGLGLVVCTALLMLSSRRFFPHYMTYLLPVLGLPIAIGLDRLWTRFDVSWLHGMLAAFVVLAALGMTHSTVLYNSEVTRPGGVLTLYSMLGEVARGPQPASVSTTGRERAWALGTLSWQAFGKGLVRPAQAKAKYLFRNDVPVKEECVAAPPATTCHNGIALQRLR